MDKEKEQFLKQKAALKEQILLKLETMQTNINLMNTNIQTLNSISQQFDETSQLWTSFHQKLRADQNNTSHVNQGTMTLQ